MNLSSGAWVAVMTLASYAVCAQPYPAKPVRVVVPYAGGVERDVKLQAGVSKPPPGFQTSAFSRG